MPFDRGDITHIGYVPGTTAHEYGVLRDGREVGRVRVATIAEIVNRGDDPLEWVANRLTEVEEGIGSDGLDRSLRLILQL